MEAVLPFLLAVGGVFVAIAGLKAFFTLWLLVEKRLHPEKLDGLRNTPEVAFGGLRGRSVDVHMKSGEVLRRHRYTKTLLFGDGEFSVCALVYFELESAEGKGVFVCGADVARLETAESQPPPVLRRGGRGRP